ncbi:hypothetical protein [Hymenobacter lucidus]|uniref:Uncharacterized protein n=1 Tax=Hymenobacter lucidus TaxID=2880930 RepID=A0ABS8AZE0_9BACT|nr:hypothetical protein [Hymenobacter lucidus]MCB2411134.1 hypothetical protein [Hymenobacter lucidus]
MEPLPGYDVLATAATASGDLYLVGVLGYCNEQNSGPEDGPAYLGSNAFVTKRSAATHQLAWLVAMGH